MSNDLLDTLLEGTGTLPAVATSEEDLEAELEGIKAAIEAVAADVQNIDEETAALVGPENPFLFIDAHFILPAPLAMWFLEVSRGNPSALMSTMLMSIRENPTAEANLRETAASIERFAEIAMQVAEDAPEHLERFNRLVNLAADANSQPREDSDLIARLTRETAEQPDSLGKLEQWGPGMSRSARRRVEMKGKREAKRRSPARPPGFKPKED